MQALKKKKRNISDTSRKQRKTEEYKRKKFLPLSKTVTPDLFFFSAPFQIFAGVGDPYARIILINERDNAKVLMP